MGGLITAAALMQVASAHAAAPAETVPATPAAVVSGHTVTHSVEKLRISVPPAAVYAGFERFNLYGVADAEIHVFVEPDAAKKVQRLYWIQFESYLPFVPHGYNYAEGNARIDIAGTPTWVNAGPMTGDRSRPGSDKESVLRILAEAGYTLPAEAMHVRLVQMLDDPQGTGKGRRELMIIYAEDLAPTGKTVSELVDDAAWKPLEQPLIHRAAKALRVERQ